MPMGPKRILCAGIAGVGTQGDGCCKGLPNRRRANLLSLDHADSTNEVAVGTCDNGAPGELFISGARTGGELNALLP